MDAKEHLMSETVYDSGVHPWLAQFAPAGRHYVIAWFNYSVSQRAQTPEGILEIVARVCSRKLEGSMSPSTEHLCQGVLLALVHQRPGALSYAQTLLDRPAA
jgi:hypothetical protein